MLRWCVRALGLCVGWCVVALIGLCCCVWVVVCCVRFLVLLYAVLWYGMFAAWRGVSRGGPSCVGLGCDCFRCSIVVV